jgi:hypothetical protein
MWQFTKIWESQGTTVYPEVCIKLETTETDTTVSVKGSHTFKDIPKDVLQEYTPPVYVPKSRAKVK